jgi:integrase
VKANVIFFTKGYPTENVWIYDARTNLPGITKKDRPVIDPFSIQETEALIAAIHRDWGEAQGNYDEFRFFTGLRPSEQIALLVSDCDIAHGKISVSKARVMARDKDRTKTSTDRLVELCPRALQVLKRHLALRARLQLAGKIQHEDLFFMETGEPIRNLQYPWVRWRSTRSRSASASMAARGAARQVSQSLAVQGGGQHGGSGRGLSHGEEA